MKWRHDSIEFIIKTISKCGTWVDFCMSFKIEWLNLNQFLVRSSEAMEYISWLDLNCQRNLKRKGISLRDFLVSSYFFTIKYTTFPVQIKAIHRVRIVEWPSFRSHSLGLMRVMHASRMPLNGECPFIRHSITRLCKSRREALANLDYLNMFRKFV